MSLEVSAHIGYLFTDVPLLDRVVRARQAGFHAVEHPAPFEHSAKVWKQVLDAEGMKFAQRASSSGNIGPKGLACVLGSESEFADHWMRALDFAEEIECRLLHAMAGVVVSDCSSASAAYRCNIERAVLLAEGRKVKVMVEAISQRTVLGFFLDSLEAVRKERSDFRDNIQVLLVTFHAAVNNEDTAEFLHSSGFSVGHVHVADYPDRCEPGTGDLNFEQLKIALSDIGYRGFVGFECNPSQPPESWIRSWLA